MPGVVGGEKVEDGDDLVEHVDGLLGEQGRQVRIAIVGSGIPGSKFNRED